MEEEIKKEYYDNGNLKSEGNFSLYSDCISNINCSGCPECLLPVYRKNGKWKYYYENGKLKKEGNYIIDFSVIGLPIIKDGLWRFFYSNGQLKMEGKYKQKVGFPVEVEKVGVWKVYNKNGNLSQELIYKNGKIV